MKEPTKEAYEELLKSVQVCIDKIEDYDYDDAAYIKLTMYQEIGNLLNHHRKGFATVKVEKKKVLRILEIVCKKAEALSVTQQSSMTIQDHIQNFYPEYRENMERSYENTEERGE